MPASSATTRTILPTRLTVLSSGSPRETETSAPSSAPGCAVQTKRPPLLTELVVTVNTSVHVPAETSTFQFT